MSNETDSDRRIAAVKAALSDLLSDDLCKRMDAVDQLSDMEEVITVAEAEEIIAWMEVHCG